MEERMEGLVGERDNLWTSVAMMALIGGVVTALLYTKRGRQSLPRSRGERGVFHRRRSLREASACCLPKTIR